MNKINSLIKEISNKRFTFLFGSGLSKNSGLPDVYDILSSIFKYLGINKNERKIFVNYITNIKQLPFEYLIEQFIQFTQDYSFLKMFSLGRPNTNQMLMAKLVNKKIIKCIYTTNFDLLLERALYDIGLSENEDYEVYKKENEIRETESSNKFPIYKLHGSYEEDSNNESIRVTLSQITSKKLSEERKILINRIFTSRKYELIVIAGYSLSDNFDINPIIEKIRQTNKKIVYIDHCNLKRPRVISIKEKKGKNPFQKSKLNGVCVRIDTNLFIKKMWDYLLNEEEYVFRETRKVNWEKYISNWINKLSKCEKSIAVGNIYYLLSDYAKSMRYYEKSLRFKEKSDKMICMANIKIGTIYQKTSKFNQARECFDVVQKISSENEELLYFKSKSIYQIGRVNEEVGNFRDAIKYYRESLRIDKLLNDLDSTSIVYHELGKVYQECYKNFDRALKYYKKSLKIKEERGNSFGYVTTSHQIGNVLYEQKKYSKALKIYNEIEELANKLEFTDILPRIYHQKGLVFKKKRDYSMAKEYFKKSLALKKKLFDYKGISINYLDLGLLDLRNGDLLRAKNKIKNAIKFALESNYYRCLSQDYYYLCIIYCKLGDKMNIIKNIPNIQKYFSHIVEEETKIKINKLLLRYNSK